MGSYICIADNAIPPVAKYKFNVEVHCEFLSMLKFVKLCFNSHSQTNCSHKAQVGSIGLGWSWFIGNIQMRSKLKI